MRSRSLLGALAAATCVLALAPGDGRRRDARAALRARCSARVSTDPFGLEFVDRADGEVLRTVGGAAAARTPPASRYGPLGYSFDLRLPVVNNAFLGYYVAAEVETLWFHATRVVESHREGDDLVLTRRPTTRSATGSRFG